MLWFIFLLLFIFAIGLLHSLWAKHVFYHNSHQHQYYYVWCWKHLKLLICREVHTFSSYQLKLTLVAICFCSLSLQFFGLTKTLKKIHRSFVFIWRQFDGWCEKKTATWTISTKLDTKASNFIFLFVWIRQPKYIQPQREGYSYPKPSVRFELPTTTRKPVPVTYLPPTTPAVCVQKFYFIFYFNFICVFNIQWNLRTKRARVKKNWTADGMPKQSLSGRLFHNLVSSRLHSTAQLTVLSIGSHLSAQWLLFDKGHINKLKTQRSSPQRFYQKT